MRLQANAVVGLAVGLALGVWLGRSCVPTQSATGTTTARGGQERAARHVSTPPASWLAQSKLAARVSDLEALLEEARSDDWPEVVRGAIATLSDRELQSILASTVQLSAEEIGDVHDLRAFAERLVEIATDDVLRPAGGDLAVEPIVFATSPDAHANASRAASVFGGATERIYAVFPTEDLAEGEVMVKWHRRDRPEILLLKRYPVVAGDTRGYVWLSPDAGWEAGQYGVDVYTGDEAMTHLASGHYWIQ